jgi:hypothetical protein
MIIENENFLSPDEIKKCYEYVSSQNFPYYFHPVTVIDTEYKNQILEIGTVPDNPFFVHSLYRNGAPNSEHFNFLIQIFYKFCQHTNVPIRAVLRAKVNLHVANHRTGHYPAHVDLPYDHKAFIYYFNDSDGDTVIFKEKFNNESVTRLTEIAKIKPVRGKGIIFDGKHYHAPSAPISSNQRFLMNVDFL